MLKKLRVPVIFVAIIILLYFVGIMRQSSKIGKNKQKMEIVNVSYDPTRELYERYNGLFKAYYKENMERMWILSSHTEVQDHKHVQ